MKHIIVTGGAGFMGINFVDHYLTQGERVTLVDNLSRKGAGENLEYIKKHPRKDNLNIVITDIRNPSSALSDAVESSELVFHFAGQVAVTTSVTDPRKDFEENALGTFNMLELVRQSKGNRPAFFFSSTNKVYGGMEDVGVKECSDHYAYISNPLGIAEDRVLDFHSPYGCSKGAADQYVRDYARIYDLKTVVFRQSCIYGYRQFGVEDQGWVAWFTIAAILGKPITIYGNGKQVRDVLFIEDLIRAYDHAASHIETAKGKVYNVGGGPENAVSLMQLIDLIEKRLNKKLSLTFGNWRPGDQPIYISDIRKAEKELDWHPAISWKEGVDRLMGWIEANRSVLERLF